MVVTVGAVARAIASGGKEAVSMRDGEETSSVGSPSPNNNSVRSEELTSPMGVISLPNKFLPT